MEHHGKRDFGRIKVSQPLVLRSEKNPGQSYAAAAVDVSEVNIGIETEALLSVGERIQLEMETPSKTITVQAIVKRVYKNRYGCYFVDDDYGKIFSYYMTKMLNTIISIIGF